MRHPDSGSIRLLTWETRGFVIPSAHVLMIAKGVGKQAPDRLLKGKFRELWGSDTEVQGACHI